MQLYSGSSRDFITDATRNQIAGKLQSAFVDTYHAKPSLQEVQSWQDSLLQMATTLQIGSMVEQGILLEYQLPLSSRRLDCMVTGQDAAGHAQSVIVELKQWGGQVEPSNAEGNVAVWVAGRVRDVLHPSQQVYQYEQYLRDVHSVFTKGSVGLRSCAYLHNLTFNPGNEIYSARHAIVGRDLRYDPEIQDWVGDYRESRDGLLTRMGRANFTAFVKNTYRVLMTRGMKGCYVHFLDDETRRFFEYRMQ